MTTLTERVLLALSVLTLAIGGVAQQVADPDFDTRVTKPAYTTKHPKVLFDEAHNNFHTTTGRYKAFADLITNDGSQVTANSKKFSKESLAGFDILVISNALGASAMGSPEAANPAFTDEECDAVRDWVRAGASLLLIADHSPMGAAAEKLSLRFGVEMSKGFTADLQTTMWSRTTLASSNTIARTTDWVSIRSPKGATLASACRALLRSPVSR